MSGTINAAWNAVISSWERPGSQHYPQGLLQTESNFNVLRGCLLDAIAKGVQPSMEKWKQIVSDATPRLQFDAPRVERVTPPVAAPAFNPAENLPHSNLKVLGFLRTVEDVNKFKARVGRDGLSYMSGFRRLTPTSKDYEELNERMQFIVDHKLHGPATPEPQSLTPAQTELQNLLADGQRIIDGLSPASIGSVTSAGGRWQQLADLKQRLTSVYSRMRYQTASGMRATLQQMRDIIAKAENTSTR
jgi:hypothetical protein